MKVTVHPLGVAPKLPPGVAADESLITRLQESFRPLVDSQPSLADVFYAKLFAAHPQLRSMFPRDMSQQKKKLLETLNLVVENLRSPQTVKSNLERVGATHTALGVQPEHYPMVITALRGAMAELSGSRWTDELNADWSSALSLVAHIMIDAPRNAAG